MAQQKSPHEEFILFAIVLFLLYGICWIIWYFFSLEITNAIRWLRVSELYIVREVFGAQVTVQHPSFGPQQPSTWMNYLKRVPVERISFQDFMVSTFVSVLMLKYVFVGAFALMAGVLIMRGPTTRYRRRLNLEGLIREQALAFPTIAPFVKFDPRKLPFRAPGQPVPADLPLFAEALSPEEWMAHNGIQMTGGQIDANKTYQALVKQLGRRWQGPLKLPLHAQGIFAACALRHVRKRKEAEDMLNQLAMSWSADNGFKPSGKLKRQIRAVIKNPKLGGALQKFADQHAFEATALLRCLSRAREEGGVMAPATFVWLRGHDRTLWYPLNNLGRKAYHAEAVGALVHYTNEIIAGQKIPTPRFDEVIQGIQEFMKGPSGRPIPDVDRKATGKYWKKKA